MKINIFLTIDKDGLVTHVSEKEATLKQLPHIVIHDHFKDKIKEEIESGCIDASRSIGKKISLVPDSLRITNIPKEFTNLCGKCKSKFTSKLEYNGDKRFQRSLRCPDCVIKEFNDKKVVTKD
jgi:hypothetical protein